MRKESKDCFSKHRVKLRIKMQEQQWALFMAAAQGRSLALV